MKLNWKFWGGGRGRFQTKKPSMGGGMASELLQILVFTCLSMRDKMAVKSVSIFARILVSSSSFVMYAIFQEN